MEISLEFKNKVASALLSQRQNFTGKDAPFAKQYGISSSIYSRLKGGERDKLLRETEWLNIGRKLGISLNERKWNTARTDVFNVIEEDINFCKRYSKAQICVDDCGIGKTYTAKYLSRTLKNCFYIDASQAKTKQQLVRLIAQTVGIDNGGKYVEVLENLKYYLKMLPEPIVIIDEAGDLQYDAFLELKGLWNATENACGWYLIGADGLRAKIYKGIKNHKVGYKEIFSRFSHHFTTIAPRDRDERVQFYKKLITDVLSVNVSDQSQLNGIVRRCLVQDGGSIGGLRRAESLLILNQN